MNKSPSQMTAHVGRPAPGFEVVCTPVPGHPGRVRRLEDYRDRWLILMFYPRDFSLVCPTELLALSQRYEEFLERGADVLAISTDPIEFHERWIATPRAQGGLGPISFPLGSDPAGDAARAYNACAELQCVALRGLVIIDPNAVVQYQVIHNMSVGRRTEEVMRVLTALQNGGLCPENWTPGEETIDPGVSLRAGSMISHYRIEERIGAGSFATVYRAYDRALQRHVALKILSRTDDRTPGIQSEARAAAALNHPNVCTIYGIDDSEGILMIVMECLVGRTLETLLAEGPLPAHQVIKIGRQIAAGMTAAHKAGVVHGDLKPANIIVTNTGTAKILDFGLAGRHRIEHSGEGTLPLATGIKGTIAGTPAYMSPEQACGAPASTASDVFSFGLILYELLAGKRSYADLNILQILERIRAIQPEDFARAVDEPFGSILQRMLVRDPRTRIVTMREIEDELKEQAESLRT